MTAEVCNSIIISDLYDRNEVDKQGYSLMSMEDSRSLWYIGEYIKTDSIPFKIVRIFSFFKNFFPEALSRWYLNNVKKVFNEYNSQINRVVHVMITDAPPRRNPKATVAAHQPKLVARALNNSVLSTEQYQKLQYLKTTQFTINFRAKKLVKEGFTHDELDRAIDQFHASAQDVRRDEIEDCLRQFCLAERAQLETEEQNRQAWAKQIVALEPDLVRMLEKSVRFSDFASGKKGATQVDLDQLRIRHDYLAMLEWVKRDFSDQIDTFTYSQLQQQITSLIHSPVDLSPKSRSRLDHIERVSDDLFKSLPNGLDTKRVADVLKDLLSQSQTGVRKEVLQEYLSQKVRIEPFFITSSEEDAYSCRR